MAIPGEDPVPRYRFSREILGQVRMCFQTDNWHGPLECLEHWLVIAAWVCFSLWGWLHLHHGAAIATYLLAIFFIGGRQRALAGLLHQACHGTLMRNPALNRIVATLLGGYPVLQSFSGYRASHVLNHHGRFGDSRFDPDYLHYQENGLCGENLTAEALRRFLFRLAGPRSTLAYVTYLIRHRVWNRDEDRLERYLRTFHLAAVVLIAFVTGWFWVLVAYWLVPLVTTQAWIGSVVELWEHYPMIESTPRIDIYMSRNRRYGVVASLLLGEKQGEGYHLVHHLFPRVPIWRVRDVHQILMSDPLYASLNQTEGLLASWHSIFAALPSIPAAF